MAPGKYFWITVSLFVFSSVNVVGTDTWVRPVQSSKAVTSIDVVVSRAGRTSLSRLEQSLNARASICRRLCGKERNFSFLHFSNALGPMDVTPSGTTTVWSDVQDIKALHDILLVVAPVRNSVLRRDGHL